MIIILLLVGASTTNAQYNSLGLYNPHFTFNKAEFIPSKLGDNQSKVEFRIIPNAYVYGANSLLSIKTLMYPTTSGIDKAVDNANDYTILGAGVEIPGMAISYKLGKTKELMTFALSNKTRALANVLLDDNFLKLVWNGNKQFEGKTIGLNKFGASSIAATEIGLGWAMPLNVGPLKMRVGANLKYLLAFGGGYVPESSATMETATDGRYITLKNLSYEANVAYLDDENTFTGNGFAMDLSTTLDFGKDINASVAVLDIGSLTFDKNTYSYSGGGDVTIEGVVLDDIFEDNTFKIDSAILAGFNSKKDSGKTFSMGMPTRLVVHLEKKILKGDYVKHGIYLTYIQGFNNISGATTKPYFAAGYSYSLKNILNVGPTVNYGGYGGFGLGAFLSAKVGPLRIGVGSNAGLSYLMLPSATKSVDFSFMTTWCIGAKKEKDDAPSID